MDHKQSIMRFASVMATSLLGISFFASAPSAAAEAVEVTVDPRSVVEVEGYRAVQPIFGVTCNGETHGERVEQVRAMAPNSARAYLWPLRWWSGNEEFSPAPTTPGEMQQKGTPGEEIPSAEETYAQWERFFDQDFSPLFNAWYEDKLESGVPQALQPKLFSAWGLTENLVFQPRIGPYMRHRIEDTKRYFGDYIDWIERINPALNVDFVQLFNEPNYPKWGWDFESKQESAEAYIRTFDEVDQHLRDNHPHTRLLGPCLASRMSFSWQGWEQWFKPMIRDLSHPPRYMNYHNYAQGAFHQLSWIQMMQAYADSLDRPRPRSVITEMNFDLWDRSNHRRFQWWAQHLFLALEHPDKHHIYNYFLITLGGRWPHAGLFGNLDAGLPRKPMYWLYHTMAWTRGDARYVKPHDTDDLHVFATAPATDQLVVSIFNDHHQPRSVSIRTGLSDQSIRQVRQRIAYVHEDQMTHEQREMPTEADTQVELPPFAVTSLRFDLTEPQTPERTLRVDEFYSETVAADFVDAQLELALPVERLPRDYETVRLRFAVYLTDTMAARGLTAALNGQARSVTWDDAPSGRIKEGDKHHVRWVSIPIALDEVRPNNTLLLSEADTDYRLLFASLVYRQHPDARAAAEIEARHLNAWSRRIEARLSALGMFSTREAQTLKLTVDNPTDQPATFDVTFRTDDGLVLQMEKAATRFTLASGESRAIDATVRAQDPHRTVRGNVVAVVRQGDRKRELSSPAVAHPPIHATRVSQPPKIDGRFEDWKQIPSIEHVEEQKRINAESRLAWDAEHLYLAVRIDSGKPPGQSSLSQFYLPDVIELFIDLGHEKSMEYDANDGQVFLTPKGPGARARGGLFMHERRGDFVEKLGPKFFDQITVSSKIESWGYRLEAAVPWSLIDARFTPEVGRRLGINLAVNHVPDRGGAFGDSLIGLEGKWHGRPHKWAVLELIDKKP